jgi:hypothetical protein
MMKLYFLGILLMKISKLRLLNIMHAYLINHKENVYDMTISCLMKVARIIDPLLYKKVVTEI